MTLDEALEKCSDCWGEGLPLVFSCRNGEIDDLWQMLSELKRLEQIMTKEQEKIWKEINNMGVKQAWELYKIGFKNVKDIESKKHEMNIAYSKIRECAKNGYSLCRVDELRNSLKTIQDGAFENGETNTVDLMQFILNLLERCCE